MPFHRKMANTLARWVGRKKEGIDEATDQLQMLFSGEGRQLGFEHRSLLHRLQRETDPDRIRRINDALRQARSRFEADRVLADADPVIVRRPRFRQALDEAAVLFQDFARHPEVLDLPLDIAILSRLRALEGWVGVLNRVPRPPLLAFEEELVRGIMRLPILTRMGVEMVRRMDGFLPSAQAWAQFLDRGGGPLLRIELNLRGIAELYRAVRGNAIGMANRNLWLLERLIRRVRRLMDRIEKLKREGRPVTSEAVRELTIGVGLGALLEEQFRQELAAVEVGETAATRYANWANSELMAEVDEIARALFEEEAPEVEREVPPGALAVAGEVRGILARLGHAPAAAIGPPPPLA